MDNKNDDIAIGIDLGTTYSCVAFFDEEKGDITVVPTETGENTLPSVVAFQYEGNNKEVLVGKYAKDLQVLDTFYFTKRYIGKDFSEIFEDLKKHPVSYKLAKEDNGTIGIIDSKGNKTNPISIASYILSKLIKTAEEYLNKKIKKVVITVPAYFNVNQREATKNAAIISGVEV